MTAGDIQKKLKGLARWDNIYVPEFTFGGLRLDAILIDVRHRWIRGFEIKVSKQDFKQDIKWTMYSEFCSSLSIVCPEGLIQPEEIKSPFGLVWIKEKDTYGWNQFVWKKRPKNFQKRDSLAWLWTYVKVIEIEFARMSEGF